MARNVIYWITTALVSVSAFFAAYAYLSASSQAVQGFAAVGYPQQLRIILGIAKPLGAIALLVPGFLRLKEWAYAGFTFAWISACIAHYLAGQHKEAVEPLILLALLTISYLTRPENRKLVPTAVA
jgi:DoxX-like family